jgi:hypothetical protein
VGGGNDVSERVSTFFGGCGNFQRFFFIAFLIFELPLLRNAQKRDKNNRAKQPRREGKKNGGNKTTFFVMSPDFFLSFFPVFLNSPLATKRPKTGLKQIDEKKGK